MPSLPTTLRGRGDGGEQGGGEGGGSKKGSRIEFGNPPRIFRSRFTGFHIMFRTVDIRRAHQMIIALSIISLFSLLATILYFMMLRFENRAIQTRKRRYAAAPMFALRLLFVYTLILLVEIMNIWVIFAVALGHMLGWLLYFVYIKDCLSRRERDPDRGGASDSGDDDDGGKLPGFEDSSVSSRSSGGQRTFWDIA